MNKLFEKFGEQKRWISWQPKEIIERNGDKKMSKIPLGKSNDPSTWHTLSEIKDQSRVGIMFGLDKKFLGIDIDHCVNPQTNRIEHSERDNIIELIKKADTYMELSPSGTGVHLYFELTEPLELEANKKAPYECYSSLRFFTVTGNSYGKEKNVRTITAKEALDILSVVGYPWGKEKKSMAVTINTPIHININDTDIIKKMFNAKNGKKIQSLYNGDTKAYGDDMSTADMALVSMLAFWTRKDAEQMERIWINSPLGARAKTQEREDYRTRTITFAIENCDTVYEPPMPKSKVQVAINEDEYIDIDFDFLFTLKGKEKTKVVTLCTENICRVLRKHPEFKGKYRLDDFKGKYELYDGKKWIDFEDVDILKLQSRIAEIFTEFQTVKKEMIYDAVLTVGKENEIDSAKDYLRSVVWDKIPRLDQWLCNTYGVEDNLYHRAVGSNWMKGLVKRIMQPGCKFDYVLVLEGEQGTKKSSSLATLGRDWHVETTMSPDTKDFFMQFSSKAIVEFSEGETLSRTDVKKLKAIITTQQDKYRMPYGKISLDHPRRCVFAMTTNTDEYLKDETGNRRWLPVKTLLPRANLEWLEANRDQLFAEAYQRVIVSKETTWEFPDVETREEQSKRRISDANEDLIVDWYLKKSSYEKNEGITVTDIYFALFTGGFGSISKPISKYDEMNIANVLKNILKLEKKQTSVDGIRKIRWYPVGMIESEFKVEDKQLVMEDF